MFESLAARALEGETPENTVAVDLFTMAARVYESDIGSLDHAVQHYRKVLEIDPRGKLSLHAVVDEEQKAAESEGAAEAATEPADA